MTMGAKKKIVWLHWFPVIILCSKFILLVSSLDCGSLYTGSFGNPSNQSVCYFIPDEISRTWQQAVDYCSGLTAGDYRWFILELKDSTEDDYLRDQIQSMTSVEPFWIGQNDRDIEHVWQYVNTYSDCETSGVYRNWRGYQPNGNTDSNGDEDCIAFYINTAGLEDKTCDETFYTICKTSTEFPKAGIAGTPSISQHTVLGQYPDCTSLSSHAFGHPTDPSRCYRLSSTSTTYNEAMQFCPKYGWSLVNIEDEDENAIIYQKYRTSYSHAHGYWLAQNDIASENIWAYHDQSTCNGVFLNFDEGNKQPDGGTTQNCLVMDLTSNGKWKDTWCSDNFYIMCKLIQEPIGTVSAAVTSPITSPATTTKSTTLETTHIPTTTLATTRPLSPTLSTTNPPTTLPTTKTHISTVTPTTALTTTESRFTTLVPTTKDPTTILPTKKSLSTMLPTTKRMTTSLPTTTDFSNRLKYSSTIVQLHKQNVSVISIVPRLSTTKTRTTLRCATACSRNPQCSSFTFQQSITCCELFSTTVDETQMSAHIGSRYFVMS